MRRKVLFVCIHNSARSQLAEALMNTICAGEFEAESAGIEPGTLNPLAVAVLQERGIDISRKQTRGVSELFQTGRLFNYVITVCDQAAETCPIFPGKAQRIHWSFPDPATVEGSDAEILAAFEQVRDGLEAKLTEWIAELSQAPCDMNH